MPSWRTSSHSASGDCVEVASWRTSSYSRHLGECVEVGQDRQVIAVRDSKNPGGPVLAFSPTEWRALLHGLTG
jgi:hypothetical protein